MEETQNTRSHGEGCITFLSNMYIHQKRGSNDVNWYK